RANDTQKPYLYALSSALSLVFHLCLESARITLSPRPIATAYGPGRGRQEGRHTRLVYFDGHRHVKAAARCFCEGISVHQGRPCTRGGRATDESNSQRDPCRPVAIRCHLHQRHGGACGSALDYTLCSSRARRVFEWNRST